MFDALSSTIHLSYLPPPMIGTTHMLLLWVAWTLLIVSWIIACIRAPDSRVEDRYTMIERTLITKRAASPLGYQNKEHAQEHQECSICQSPLQENDLVSWSPNAKCCHVYHHMCVKRWLLEHSDCPSCRQSLDKYETVSSRLSGSYFCVRDGLQQASHVDDERTRCISPDELKQYRVCSFIAQPMKDQDDSWESAELLQSYGRHMRLPPCIKRESNSTR